MNTTRNYCDVTTCDSWRYVKSLSSTDPIVSTNEDVAHVAHKHAKEWLSFTTERINQLLVSNTQLRNKLLQQNALLLTKKVASEPATTAWGAKPAPTQAATQASAQAPVQPAQAPVQAPAQAPVQAPAQAPVQAPKPAPIVVKTSVVDYEMPDEVDDTCSAILSEGTLVYRCMNHCSELHKINKLPVCNVHAYIESFKPGSTAVVRRMRIYKKVSVVNVPKSSVEAVKPVETPSGDNQKTLPQPSVVEAVKPAETPSGDDQKALPQRKRNRRNKKSKAVDNAQEVVGAWADDGAEEFEENN
jgi:hypothetical protein